MKPVKDFNEYIKEGTVKNISPDKSRSYSLVQDSSKDYNFLVKIINNMEITNENANHIIKSSYDIIMQLIRAKMFLDGYHNSE